MITDMNTKISHELFDKAQQRIPGGVNSPVRAFRAVGGGIHFLLNLPKDLICMMKTATGLLN